MANKNASVIDIRDAKHAVHHTDLTAVLGLEATVRTMTRSNGGTYHVIDLAPLERNGTYLVRPCEYQTGYVVAGRTCETFRDVPTAQDIAAFILEHQRKFRPGAFDIAPFLLGTWHDQSTGNWYLEAAIHTESLETACAFGTHNEQVAIWDVANCRAIYLADTVDTLPANVPTPQRRYARSA